MLDYDIKVGEAPTPEPPELRSRYRMLDKLIGSKHFKVFAQDEAVVFQRNLNNLFFALRQIDELVRLVELRVEELENAARVKNLPGMIDGHGISVNIGSKRGDSK